MLERLQRELDSIRKRETPFVLANDIKICHISNPIFGITFKIFFPQHVQDEISQIQRELTGLDDAFIPVSEKNHISVNPVVLYKGVYVKGNEQTWKDIEQEFLSKLSHLDYKFSSFSLTFSDILVTREAVTWCADDKGDSLQNIRRYLKEALPFPEETIQFNMIVHTTLARYAKPIRDPKRLLAFAQAMKKSVTMDVCEIDLMHEYNFEPIQESPLATIHLLSKAL